MMALKIVSREAGKAIAKLEAENQELRAEVERLKKELIEVIGL